ncbi:MAG: ribonuclease P protein component [Bacteroidia bacterium]
MPKQTFKKQERLCSQILIEELIKTGKFFSVAPFRVVWKKAVSENNFLTQILISVPKRKFKRAVDRNHLKRLIREAYRKNKETLLLQKENTRIAFIYTSSTSLSYAEIESKILLILQRLSQENE